MILNCRLPLILKCIIDQSERSRHVGEDAHILHTIMSASHSLSSECANIFGYYHSYRGNPQIREWRKNVNQDTHDGTSGRYLFIYINIYTHTHKHASCMEYIIVRIFLDLGKKSSHMAFLLHFFIRQSYVQMRQTCKTIPLL